MSGFRQMLFSKIVPNLKRLGLLTPRVREVYAKLDLLRFEHMKDCVEDPEVAAAPGAGAAADAVAGERQPGSRRRRELELSAARDRRRHRRRPFPRPLRARTRARGDLAGDLPPSGALDPARRARARSRRGLLLVRERGRSRRRAHALDANPGFAEIAAPDVQTQVGRCDDLSAFPAQHFDVVFASNLLEHLAGAELETTLREVRRVLRPGGRFLLVQPNFRYCVREYFDDYTHRTIFTHVSLADCLAAHGFAVEHVAPRFLPLSFKSRLPSWPWLVDLYLRLPWRPLAKQMLVVGAP